MPPKAAKPKKAKKPYVKGVHKMDHTPEGFKNSAEGKQMWREYNAMIASGVKPIAATAVLKKKFGIWEPGK
jgi:hypothetical protein